MKNIIIEEDSYLPQKEKIKKGKSFVSQSKISRDAKSEQKFYRKRRKMQKRRFEKYSKYLDSKEWLKRKKDYYSKHPKECAICRTKQDIDLHHMSYRNLGNERDSDLVPLCHPHHEEYHNTNQNISKETTFKFIHQKQNELSLKNAKM